MTKEIMMELSRTQSIERKENPEERTENPETKTKERAIQIFPPKLTKTKFGH
jgi:hypothetical protein